MCIRDRAPAAGAETINSPMPGNILDVKVAAGDSVKSGKILLILEAMKMENEIVSPRDGVIASVHVGKGDTVDSGTVSYTHLLLLQLDLFLILYLLF